MTFVIDWDRYEDVPESQEVVTRVAERLDLPEETIEVDRNERVAYPPQDTVIVKNTSIPQERIHQALRMVKNSAISHD